MKQKIQITTNDWYIVPKYIVIKLFYLDTVYVRGLLLKTTLGQTCEWLL